MRHPAAGRERRMLRYVLLALCLVGCALSEGEGEERARLLAAKRVHNLYLVEGRDIVVQYSVHNVGQAAAINVQLTDSGFSTEDFEVAGGQLQVKFDRIAPSANVSHTVVVKPKKFGYFNFTAAEVSYQPSEDTAEIQIGYTSEPGEGGIIAYRDYDRKFSPHVFDWIIFALLMIPVLLVPFLMWYNIKSKYVIPTHGGKKGKSD
ncbi:hypothetical protein Pmani_028050 [Petrolisthes manimaculis]|uniref:Translocon-associated protein subunit beta n=1 Tax=Petrolisthes manimaculis TaxID=1843537 RepID=A0AAE1P2X4_9EUCA|nr:hypothetical protein Pmani_028050 [Petrolisthes manimaculis]